MFISRISTLVLSLLAACGGGNTDQDSDGIVGKDDECPNEPEDVNGFYDADGCPDGQLDNDSDGVLDFEDRCLANPGTVELSGCPAPSEAEQALKAWEAALSECQNTQNASCQDVMSVFNALADVDKTLERKAQAEADVQIGLVWSIGDTVWRPEQVDELKALLSGVSDEAKRTELGIETEKEGSSAIWLE